MEIKIFEAFAGYGSQVMALKRLKRDYPNFTFKTVGISEIDKYAIQAYNAVHGETTNYGDISKIDWNNVPDFDLFTYSFPCQDISSIGKQKGLKEGSGTRSSLLWECRKAVEIKKPKYLLMENVKFLLRKKFLPYLGEWMDVLSLLGYSNFISILNSKDYGVPQNRERVFMVSILNDDLEYEFPTAFPLDILFQDILEENVDKKYLIKKNEKGKYNLKNLNYMVDNNMISKNEIQYIDTYNLRVLKEVSGTITTRVSTSNQTFVSLPISHDSCLIRKLTPKECFRLMGISEEDIYKLENSGISNANLYKLAGNSIVVDVLYYIFKNMFIK